MNLAPAWKKGYTGKGVVVSILDDGIQTNHPDLAQNYVSSTIAICEFTVAIFIYTAVFYLFFGLGSKIAFSTYVTAIWTSADSRKKNHEETCNFGKDCIPFKSDVHPHHVTVFISVLCECQSPSRVLCLLSFNTLRLAESDAG
jgi:hypothetical protein